MWLAVTCSSCPYGACDVKGPKKKSCLAETQRLPDHGTELWRDSSASLLRRNPGGCPEQTGHHIDGRQGCWSGDWFSSVMHTMCLLATLEPAVFVYLCVRRSPAVCKDQVRKWRRVIFLAVIFIADTLKASIIIFQKKISLENDTYQEFIDVHFLRDLLWAREELLHTIT